MEPWTIDSHFSGPDIKPASLSREEPDAGAYRVKVVEAKKVETKKTAGAYRVAVVAEIKGGDWAGSRLYLSVSPPQAAYGAWDSDSNRGMEAFTKRTLLSLGHDPAKVNALNGNFKIGLAHFQDREGYVNYIPRVDADSFPTCDFVTKEQYDAVVSGALKPKGSRKSDKSDTTSTKTQASRGGSDGDFEVSASNNGVSNAGGGDELGGII